MSVTAAISRFAVLSIALASAVLIIAGGSAGSASATAGNRQSGNTCPGAAKHNRRLGIANAGKLCGAHRSAKIARVRYQPDTTLPTVSWKAPAAGSKVSGSISGTACEVAASDNRGVTRVVFSVDGVGLNTELEAPWNCHFDSTQVGDGSHKLTATAYDAAGNSRSVSQAITVSNAPAAPPADVTAPTVAWQAPLAGATVKGQIEGSSCEVAAADSSGVTSVVFKVDGSTLNTEASAPWNCHFDSAQVADGTHTMVATAYDSAGNAGSASTAVTVANGVVISPPPSGMIVGLDAGNYGSSGAADVRGVVNTVRYDSERGVSALENFKNAGLRIQMVFPGPYNEGGVCALNAATWAGNALSFYKANTNPTQTPTIEALNEPGGTWFWGPNASSSANAVCYRNLLKKTYEAFHGQYGSSAPKILGTVDGSGGLAFGKAWVTSDWATYVDGFIVHPYGGTGTRSSSALGNRALVESARAMTGGPIYITEVGWPTAVGQPSTGDSLQWSETEQATNITGFIAWAHETGYVAEVVYFNYHDYGTNNWYGVVRSDGSHKPAYEALRQAASKYGA